MAIFVIKPKQVQQQKTVTSSNDAVNHSNSNQITDDQLGEKPTDEDMEDMKKLGANMKESKITVRGPLSKVFSEALNKVLAFESIMASIATSEEDEALLSDTNANEIYVFATNQDELDYNSGMIAAADNLKLALDSKTGSQAGTKKSYLYMETSDRPSSRLDMMASWCDANKVTVITKPGKSNNSLRMAGEHIVNTLRSMS